MLSIEKTVESSRAVFCLDGQLDTAAADALQKELNGSMDGIQELVLDFEKVRYISSSGLRVLLSTHKKMSKQGMIKVIHVSDAVMDILEVTGFSDFLNIE